MWYELENDALFNLREFLRFLSLNWDLAIGYDSLDRTYLLETCIMFVCVEAKVIMQEKTFFVFIFSFES